jgi:hypothetical protein
MQQTLPTPALPALAPPWHPPHLLYALLIKPHVAGPRVCLHDGQVAGQVRREPGVLPHLGQRDALQRVHQQHARDEVARA